MRANINKTIIFLFSLAMILFFQNCGQSFITIEPASTSAIVESTSENTNTPIPDEPISLSITTNKLSLVSGEIASLEFNVSGAIEVILNPGQVNVTGKTIYPVSPTTTTQYTLTAKNRAGSTSSKSLSIIVSEPLPVISNLAASSPSITNGQSSVLSWTVSGATQLSIDPGNISVTGMSSVSVSPSATTIYTLRATNASGISSTRMVTVSVNAAPPPAPSITSFTSSAASIVSGQNVTLSWVTSEATTLDISPGGLIVTGKTSQVLAPTANTTYTLTASNVTGSVTKTVSVEVTQPIPLPDIASFSSSSATVMSGESATLSWSVTGADSLKIDPGAVDLAGKTNLSVSPTANTTYTLTATNATGSVTKNVSINFINPWLINPAPSFTVSSGQTFDLSTTLPAGIVKGGTFSVSSTGSPLPAGMTLAANGILSVGSAAVGDTSNVAFDYTEP